MGKSEPLSELHKQLLSPKTLQAYEPGSAISLFRLFDQSGFSYKGQITSGYGESGTRARVGVSFDFGDLILPGLLSAKVQGGLAAAKTSYTLIAVTRLPLRVVFPGHAPWATQHPLGLCILKGYGAQMSASIGVSARAGNLFGVDELGLQVSVAGNAVLGGKVLRLRDPYPRHYPPSAWDDSLASDFVRSLGALARADVKDMVASWLKQQGQDGRKLRVAHTPSEDLLKGLDGLEKEIPQDLEDKLSADEKAAALLTRQQIKIYRAQIKSLQIDKARAQASNNSVVPAAELDSPLDKLCSLTLFATDREAAAGAGAKLKLTLPRVGVNVDAQAQYDKRVYVVSYRFQTLASERDAIVQTQDTVISYREVDAKAAATAKAGITIPKVEKKKEFDSSKDKALLRYRTMTYQSAIVYWRYPKSKNVAVITPGSGSGVCFGMGVQASRLIEIARQLVWVKTGLHPTVADTSTALLARLAAQLHLPQERIEKFLVDAGIHDDDPDSFVNDVVLLEAGFALPASRVSQGAAAPFQLPITVVNGVYEMADTLGDQSLSGFIETPQMLADAGLLLNVMRLRYRLADGRDQTQTLFKLGFSYVVGLDLQVDKVRASGHEGVIDLYTWFADDQYNHLDTAKGQEHAVPPVALLHQ
jgi:hypothetical protein